MSDQTPPKPTREDQAETRMTKTLDAAGWGLLLVWLGITTLFSLGWPVFLIGLGLVVLVIQGVRSMFSLETETFWLILGGVFVVAGIVESFGTGFPLVPAALILFGLAALYGVYKRMTVNYH